MITFPTIPDDYLSLENRRARCRERLLKLETMLQQMGRPADDWDRHDRFLYQELCRAYQELVEDRRAISRELLRGGWRELRHAS